VSECVCVRVRLRVRIRLSVDTGLLYCGGRRHPLGQFFQRGGLPQDAEQQAECEHGEGILALLGHTLHIQEGLGHFGVRRQQQYRGHLVGD